MLAAALLTLVTSAVAAPVVPRADHVVVDKNTAGQWAVLPEFSASVALGVSFTTPVDGIVIGGENNMGAQVWATSDGGRTTLPAVLDAEAPALMLLDGDAVRDYSVASGVFAAWSSIDGAQRYRPAEGLGSIGPAQSVDGFIQGGEILFVITGSTILHNGISVSRDGGRTFAEGVEVFTDRQTDFNIGARYGAFPTEDVWFVSGGRFPSSDGDDDSGTEFHITESIHLNVDLLHRNASTNPLRFTLADEEKGASQERRAQDPLNPFTAGIAKSTDGGVTWRTIFESVAEGSFSLLPGRFSLRRDCFVFHCLLILCRWRPDIFLTAPLRADRCHAVFCVRLLLQPDRLL